MDECRVRVWFGSHVMNEYTASPERARRYAALMAQRFAGLKVTIDDAPAVTDVELPAELLWDQTVK